MALMPSPTTFPTRNYRKFLYKPNTKHKHVSYPSKLTSYLKCFVFSNANLEFCIVFTCCCRSITTWDASNIELEKMQERRATLKKEERKIEKERGKEKQS